MRAFLQKNILLLLSALFITISGVLHYTYLKHEGFKNDKAYVQSVGKRINEELDAARESSELIKEAIEKSERPTFARLLHSNRFPYFVFRNNYLYFWSDNSFTPSTELLRGSQEVRFVSQKSGKYVVHRNWLMKRGDLFEIFHFIPLYTDYPFDNDYLKSELNYSIFGNSSVNIQNHPTATGGSIFTSEGQYLFSLTIPEDPAKRNHDFFWFLFIGYSLATVFLVLYIVKVTEIIASAYGAGKSLFTALASLLILRAVMLHFTFPFSIVEFDLFNSKYYASSVFNPSLGDFLLNLVFGLIFSLLFLKYYHKAGLVKKLLQVSGKVKKIAAVILLLFCFLSLNFLFDSILEMFKNSQWQMDITESVEFGFLRITSYLIIGILFTIFLVLYYIFSNILLTLYRRPGKKQIGILAFACIIYWVLLILISDFYLPVFLLSILFSAVTLFLRMPRLYNEPKYGSYFYLLFAAVICALCASYAIYVLNLKTDLINKQKFANQLLVENDVLGEYLLNESSHLIRTDPFIQATILSPFGSKDVIEQKIKRVYLGEYFEKYDVNVHVFDALGVAFNLNSEFRYWPEVIQQFRIDQFRTEYNNIFLIYDPGKRGYKRYLVFNKIRKNGAVIGYILTELKQKKIIPHSVFPELLVDKKFLQPWENKSYSYVIFGQEGEILYSYGQYNYEKDFNEEFFSEQQLFDEGIRKSSYHHLALSGTDGRKVVVSSEDYPLKNFFSNFSFIFILLMFFILIFILLWSMNFRVKNLDLNFSTKIQIYLNLAFFLPLFIVSITTLSIISSSYKENLNKSFIKKAEGVSSTINMYLEGERGGPGTEGRLENLLLEKSRFIETDINLFDNKGKLLFTNQPMIFEAGLVSRLVNPVAYSKIQDNKNNVFMLNEKVGSLKYNSVYIAIKSYETANLLGILSIPFFESRQEIEKQLVEVLTTILNIFVSIFLIFLMLSYLVTKLLTVPLKLLTQKIRRTSLSGHNEPLVWNSKDEIGLLVGEYNRMLVKLEENKAALSRSEKESAWREMAQQVAHEIKNPLTPMKLSIQHLQRAIKERRENLIEMAEKSLEVLLEQVNTLSEIATSFSVFAKMPIPKNERFELSSIFTNIVRLHSADTNVRITVLAEKGKFYVVGDEQLTGNIISNLIINGIQSVPRERTPEIQASLKSKGKLVVVAVKDNGSGIPESIREKVFTPNFSTKYSGSGLGLALAKRGVEHAGGRIWFETMEGEGTTFFMELPLSD